MKSGEIINILPIVFREKISEIIENGNINEIRMRIGKAPLVLTEEGEVKLDGAVTGSIIKEMLDYATGHSMYAYDEAMKNGYITVRGGHRIGICGQAVLENGRIKILKNISSLNIRISHECTGCSDNIIPYIYNGEELRHTLIVSPPGCGKTTILRDLLRNISERRRNNKYINVGIVDERSEIAACYQGVPQNNVGTAADVIDNCPKAEGMMILIRTMSPDVIGVDELGMKEDVEALRYVINCGCRIFATIHGTSIGDIRKKPYVSRLLEEKIFTRYIILSRSLCNETFKRGVAIFDETGRCIYSGACDSTNADFSGMED